MFRLFPINQVKIGTQFDVILCTNNLFVIFYFKRAKKSPL
ncbi:hypothetical protein HMPREF0693_2982 [Proteus mirabilis ATCC 29906]|nr:hypothetical protein HMPREF0693_2982 [Proteus mirabilis ATCC 29906]KXC00399.1 hypothetical protein HMPREF3203_02127 [Proteus mirabilis]PVF73308.1 hypothetical protein CSC14_2704 [Proteus mirabilis]